MRDILTPLGNEDYPAVRRSNKMTSRSWVLPMTLSRVFIGYVMMRPCSQPPHLPHLPWRTVILMLIAVVSGGVFFMEQPMNSLVAMHPRYIWLVELLLQLDIPVSWLMDDIYLFDPF